MFFTRLPLKSVIAWTRALKHGSDVGLPPDRIFRQIARAGSPSQRRLAETIADRLHNGDSLEDALAADRNRFPPLLVEMVAVGEQTGRLTETFEELEQYFDTVRESRTTFIRALIWPAFMYFSAIGVIAFMLLVLGLIAPANGQGFDPLGLGMLGPGGAFAFLLMATMFTTFVVGAFLYVANNDGIRARIEGAALRVPMFDRCFRAFALQRFCLALHMTAEAGVRADRALKLAFRATTNAAYLNQSDRATKDARSGRSIHEALENCGPVLFPREFLEVVEVGEVTGNLAEVMAKEANVYRDEASRKIKWLAMLAGGLVYLMVGGMIVLIILKIVMSIAGIYEDAMRGL